MARDFPLIVTILSCDIVKELIPALLYRLNTVVCLDICCVVCVLATCIGILRKTVGDGWVTSKLDRANS